MNMFIIARESTQTQYHNATITVNKSPLQYDHDEGSLAAVMGIGFYGAIIAILLMIVALIVKLLWEVDSNEARDQVTRPNENRLLLSTEKITFSFYGSLLSDELDLESGCNSSSSDDLYDEKICAICYDDHRSCLFIPCGHRVTCYSCAKRIVDDEIKTCPICRAFILKVRRLLILTENPLVDCDKEFDTNQD